MPIQITVVLMMVLGVMSLAHVLLGWLFLVRLRTFARRQKPATRFPRATVLMSLRGSDPYLAETIAALGGQDYPNFDVSIVVDDESDPAWIVAREAVDRLSREDFSVAALGNRLPSCSLKCSSLIQGVESAGPDTEVIVLADADIVPHATWLTELIAPLEDERVGVATGNQWFAPRANNLGSWIRSVWNAGAVVPTTLLGHPWAGSCAMRLADMRESGLLDRWRLSIVDDGPIAAAYQSLGKSVQMVPSVFMVNREKCELPFCFSYIRRMLTWSRLYESTYPITVLHALTLELTCLVALMMVGLLAASGLGGWSIALAASLAVFWVANLIGYFTVASTVRRHTQDRNLEGKVSLATVCRVLIAVPVTHLIYSISAIRAWFGRRIQWRAITYEVDRKGQVVKLEYQRYRDAKPVNKAELSI